MTRQFNKTPPNDRWLIDSHIHLDMVRRFHPEKVSWLQDRYQTMVSWAFATHIKTTEQLKRYLEQQMQDIVQIDAVKPGSCFFMSGIHPRSIPHDLRPEKLADVLRPFLNHPLCLGIGEIGLETNTVLEREIFEAQLELACLSDARAWCIGIHTPRKNKAATTDAILNILGRFSDLASSIVVDHCTAETLPRVLSRGLWAGVTLSPPKTSVDQLTDIIKLDPRVPLRTMCNTDSGEEVFTDLITASETLLLNRAEKKALLAGNAASFLRLEIDEAGVVVRRDRP